ncbi:hypothetical protein Tco_0444046, partial [Tanacetum coccineum]
RGKRAIYSRRNSKIPSGHNCCSKKIPCSTKIRSYQEQTTYNEKSNDDLLEDVGNFKHSDLKTKKFEEIQALYEKIKRSYEDFISIGSAEDERLIKKMNEKGIDLSKKKEVKEESKEEESKRKRKLGTRKKMKSRKRRF